MSDRAKEFWKVNLGHLLTILGGIISLALVGGKIQARVDGLADRMITQERSMTEFTRMGVVTTLGEHERRLNTLESVANDFRETRADIRWIKDRLDKIK